MKNICRYFCLIILSLSFILMMTEAHSAKTEIIFWHSFADNLERELKAITQGFNQSQSDYTIKPVYKGEYMESLINFAAAFRANQAPALIQIFEVGSMAVLYPKGVVKPLFEILDAQHMSLPIDDFFPAVRAFYSDSSQTGKERLLAMPFNISLPVVYYNADALNAVGYSSGFPETWQEMETLMIKLKAAGFHCGYTTAYPAWIHIESFSALHGLPLFDPLTGQAAYNNFFVLSHLERLKRWQEEGLFEYGGRDSNATVLFTSGRCPLFSQSSGAYNSLQEVVKFNLGVAQLPLDKQVTLKRQANLIGGAAIWSVANQTPTVYRGIALFFKYLAEVKVQQRWYENTGYLPIGLKGQYASFSEASHPILRLAKTELNLQNPSQFPQIVGPQNLIRIRNDEALEALFAGIKTPKEALETAVRRANYLLKRFSQNTKSSPH